MLNLNRIKRAANDALTRGKDLLEFDFKYKQLGTGTLWFNNLSGPGQPGTGVLKVDGKVVDTQSMAHTLPMTLQWVESFDIGSDSLTGVNDADYKPPFALTAKLNKLKIKIDRPQISADDIKKLESAMRNNSSSE
jgi:arylsulfatase